MTKLTAPPKRKPPPSLDPPGRDQFGEFESDSKRLVAVKSSHARDVQIAQIQSRVMLAKVVAALVVALAIVATVIVIDSAAAKVLAASAGGLFWRMVGRGY